MRAFIAVVFLAGCSAGEPGRTGAENSTAPTALPNRSAASPSAGAIFTPRTRNLPALPSLADQDLLSPHKIITMALRKEMRGPLAAAPRRIALAGMTWRPIGRERLLSDALFNSRIHDPDCDESDCDEAFLEKGKYLKLLLPGDQWLQGTFRVVDNHYCVKLPRRRERCFGLLKSTEDDTLRFELYTRKPNPTLVQVLPASRGGYVYP